MHSDKRGPRVYWFNPTCDRYAGLGLGYPPSARVRAVQEDLESLPMFLAEPDDVVLVRRCPSTGFLRRLQECGFSIPEFAIQEGEGPAALARGDLARRRLDRLCPWGWSPDSVALAAPLFRQLSGEGAQEPGSVWNERLRQLYSKAGSAGFLRRFLKAHPEEASWLCGPEVIGRPCGAMAQVEEAAREYRDQGSGAVVVKAAFGAAGQNQVQLSSAEDPVRPGERQRRQVEKLLEEHGAVVVEPWLDKVMDLGVQLEVDAAGKSRVLGTTRFLTNRGGQYIGSFVHQTAEGLGPDARSFLCGDGRDPERMDRLAEKLAAMLGREVSDMGFAGPLGVDALVYRGYEGVRVKPVVEINPRYTMGHLVLEMSRQVSAAHTALWLVLRVRDIEQSGYAGPPAFAEDMEQRYPVEMGPGGDQVTQGILFTTDPARASSVVTLVAAGESLVSLKRQFCEIGRPLAAWTMCCDHGGVNRDPNRNEVQ